MNKFILSTIFLLMSGSLMTAQANVEQSFADQLMMQQSQLRQQEFNFFSDRYKQVTAQKNVLASTHIKSPSFKMQLDSQKQQLRTHKFHPVSDAYFQVHSH